MVYAVSWALIIDGNLQNQSREHNIVYFSNRQRNCVCAFFCAIIENENDHIAIYISQRRNKNQLHHQPILGVFFFFKIHTLINICSR